VRLGQKKGEISVNYLVTGATGFIGNAIAKTLKQRNDNVYGLIRQAEQAQVLQRDNLDYRMGDIRDRASLKPAFKDMHVVIHSAGLVTDWGRPEEFIQINFHGTKNVLEVCSEMGIKRVIYISTADIFGYPADHPVNENSPIKKSSSWYAKSKIMAEELARRYADNRELDMTIIYPTWVYGEGDRHFVPEIIDNILNGQMIFFAKTKRTFFGLSYVENLSHAICFLMDDPGSIGERFLVSDEPQITFQEFVNILAGKVGHKEIHLNLPYWLAYAVAGMMEATCKALGKNRRPLLTRYAVSWFGNSVIYDTTKLKSLGWNQRYSIQEGIEKTMKHITMK
jgi:2-alkyl-3-oxoalkanoate reductase